MLTLQLGLHVLKYPADKSHIHILSRVTDWRDPRLNTYPREIVLLLEDLNKLFKYACSSEMQTL